MAYCSLCEEPTEEPTYLNLYVMGSEGISVCLECRMILTHVARDIKSTAAKVRRRVIQKAIREGRRNGVSN